MLDRRSWMRAAGVVGAGFALRRAKAATALFDGRTLDGWTQIENSATSVSAANITDPAAFAARLLKGTDATSMFLRGGMPEALKADLAAYSPAAENAKATVSALVKYLNQSIGGPPIDGRAGTPGYAMAQANKRLLDETYSTDLQKSPAIGWVVKDGAMASTGSGRGVIYTARDYARFRLKFTMRHVSGNPDHQACVLIFCKRPQGDEKPLDALGGIQFQVPNGGRWDYRPGRNDNGGAEFTKLNAVKFEPHEWSRVEIVADAAKGTARMWVAQPLGSTPVEVLAFLDPAAGRTGPVAWQMHNAGLFDEYKDVEIEENPTE
jgi:hypothetical protein